MRIRPLMLSLTLVAMVLAAGCDKSTETKTDGPAKSDEPTKAKAWEKSSTMDCPAHIISAVVKLEDIEGGYVATVTTPDKDEVERLQEYAAYMAGASAHSKPPEDALIRPGHTGNRNNNCPIILADTVVTQAAIDGGARLEVRAKQADGVDALRKKAATTLETQRMMKKMMKEAMEDANK
ncbi:MAG: hypothetical protein ACI9MR_004792 [Myxococcota bacterium]|jgi:hypothetical protein